VWRPYIEHPYLFESHISAKYDDGWVGCDQLAIGAKKKISSGSEIDQYLTINVWGPVLGENNITPAKGAFICFTPCGCSYDVDTLSPYTMNITKLDKINNIASGTFEFTAISDDCQDTVRITEGRFDVDSSL